MPRRPRITLPGVPLNLIQRGNNRQACSYADEDHLLYLDGMEEYARLSGCIVHSYAMRQSMPTCH